MSNMSKLAVTTMGIDVGKNAFHVVGLDQRGAIMLRQRCSRRQVEVRLANMPPCLVRTEALYGRFLSSASVLLEAFFRF